MDDRPSDGQFPTWLLWVIGPVTVLAAALIVLALVLGIQAGQRQAEVERRQQVGIAVQRAMDYQADGKLAEALTEYQRVLVLDPGNPSAVAGIESLLQMAGGGATADALGQATPAASEGVVAPAAAVAAQSAPAAAVATPSQPLSPEEQIWQDAQAAGQAGRWAEAEEALVQLQKTAPQFRPDEVAGMLFDLYVNLAAETEQDGDLEQALTYVDKALELRPDATALRSARSMAATYLEMLTVSGTDWKRTIELLEGLYVRDSGYRDVQKRLQGALLAYGEELAADEDWCAAAEQYRVAVAIESSTETIAERNSLEDRCAAVRGPVAGATPTRAASLAGADAGADSEPDSLAAAATLQADSAAEPEAAAEAATPEPISAPAANAPVSGRIVFSAVDPVNGSTHVYMEDAAGGVPVILAQNGQQGAFRPDGRRFVYKNLRDDMRGLTSLDPGTGLELRFTEFGEDGRPSWNGEGNRITFSSNREGDRLWRVYTLWADVGSEAEVVAYGDSPAWNPAADRIAFRGCDESGNRCGIWTMNGGGGDRSPLTSVPADDYPSWASNGAFVAFMSDGRDGNPELYRVDAGGAQVTRLTDNPAIDGLPAVSPDGAWVAFVSNRGGGWAVYAVPSAGGEAQQLFALDGSLGNWLDQGLQWIP